MLACAPTADPAMTRTTAAPDADKTRRACIDLLSREQGLGRTRASLQSTAWGGGRARARESGECSGFAIASANFRCDTLRPPQPANEFADRCPQQRHRLRTWQPAHALRPRLRVRSEHVAVHHAGVRG